jgi:hypothetical protein
MLTVACVFKTFTQGIYGGAYNDAWIQKLQRSVAKHLSVPHRFVCLSNSFIPHVDVIPLQNDWEGWWSKIEMFRPGLFKGPVLSFDLDVTVLSSIDHMAGPFPNMMMLRDIIPTINNSTCMWWDASDPAYGKIYETFKADPDGLKKKHHVFNTQSMGDQGFINEIVTGQGKQIDIWQDKFGDEQFVPFSFFSRLNPIMNDIKPSPDPFSFLNTLKEPQMNPELQRAKLVYCLGKPKFDSYNDLVVVKKNWV